MQMRIFSHEILFFSQDLMGKNVHFNFDGKLNAVKITQWVLFVRMNINPNVEWLQYAFCGPLENALAVLLCHIFFYLCSMFKFLINKRWKWDKWNEYFSSITCFVFGFGSGKWVLNFFFHFGSAHCLMSEKSIEFAPCVHLVCVHSKDMNCFVNLASIQVSAVLQISLAWATEFISRILTIQQTREVSPHTPPFLVHYSVLSNLKLSHLSMV